MSRFTSSPLKIWLTVFIIGFVAVSLSAQQRQERAFDINKVREAVREGVTDTSLTDSAKANAPAPFTRSTDYFLLLLKLVGYLVVITAAIIITVKCIKRFGFSRNIRTGGGSMDVLETLPLGQNRSLILIRIMDSVFILSQTPQSITLIDKIEGNKAVELIASTKGGTSIVQFKDFFNTFIGKMKK